MVLNFTTSRIAGVIVVYLSGAILFGEESASLLILVKNLLNNSHQIVLDLGNVTHFDSGSVGTLVAVCASAVTSSLPTSAITQKRCFRLQSS
jgi:anti-anti-sigma regulatory factor